MIRNYEIPIDPWKTGLFRIDSFVATPHIHNTNSSVCAIAICFCYDVDVCLNIHTLSLSLSVWITFKWCLNFFFFRQTKNYTVIFGSINNIRTVRSINLHGTNIVSSITFTVLTNLSIKLTILSRENSVSSFVAMRRNEFL